MPCRYMGFEVLCRLQSVTMVAEGFQDHRTQDFLQGNISVSARAKLSLSRL
jgi:hypothetical protein